MQGHHPDKLSMLIHCSLKAKDDSYMNIVLFIYV